MKQKFLSLLASLLLIQGTWAAVPNVATMDWEVESGGSNTANAACFDRLTTLAGRPTDLAATSGTTATPTVSSASYNFVAGDVNQWLFIAAGTNWTPGWYKITSVGTPANAAVVDAAVGHVTTLLGGVNTIAGIATTASPTSGTWSVDYSHQTTAPFSGADLNSNTTTSVHNTAGHQYTKADVGNCVVVSGGTACTAGTYEITAVAAAVATLERAITATACVNATYAEGGALAQPTVFGTLSEAAGNRIWMQGPTIVIPGNSNLTGTTVVFSGYSTVRGDSVQVTLQANTAPGGAVITLNGNQVTMRNVIIDCNSQANDTGFVMGNNAWQYAYNLLVKNCTAGTALNITSTAICVRCFATANPITANSVIAIAGQSTMCFICGAYSNANTTTTPAFRIAGGSCYTCFSVNNGAGGSSVLGFEMIGNNGGATLIGGTSYGNTGDGIVFDGGAGTVFPYTVLNTISSNNGGIGFNVGVGTTFPSGPPFLDYNGYGNNTGGQIAATLQPGAHDVALTVDPFVNCASLNCALNNTVGGGKALKGTGFPGVLATGTGVTDIGALQSGSAAAGGTISYGFSQ